MSSGNTHDKVSIAAFTAQSIVLGYYCFHPEADIELVRQGAIALAGFAIGATWLSPDLDVNHLNTTCAKRWGCLKYLWKPYAIWFSHRGISHSLIIGTLSRVAYFLVVAVPLIGAIALLTDVAIVMLFGLDASLLKWSRAIAQAQPDYFWPVWVPFLVGVEKSAITHYLCDFRLKFWKLKRR